MSAQSARKTAFTLVELLVVIGIIALLVAILLPALNNARQSAQTIACLSNLRQISQAAQNYASDNHQYMLPYGADNAAGNADLWPVILVDGGYLIAPDSTGLGPTVNSVFFCPSGVLDIFPPSMYMNTAIPSSRTDQYGAMAERCVSTLTPRSVDCWYGMSASEPPASNPLKSGYPGRRILYKKPGLIPVTVLRRSSLQVMCYDGIGYHLEVNGNRLNARHGNFKQTNLAFYDGHAETWATEMLPGGMGNANGGITGAAFQIANLRANFPEPAPLWQLDQ